MPMRDDQPPHTGLSGSTPGDGATPQGSPRRASPAWWQRRWVAPVATAAIAVGLAAVLIPTVAHAPRQDGMAPGSANADCAAPRLSVAGATRGALVHRGQKVAVTGFGYVDGCQDSALAADTPSPLEVTIVLAHTDARRPLTTVRASGPAGRFTTTVRIPSNYPLGRATLRTGTYAERTAAVTVAR